MRVIIMLLLALALSACAPSADAVQTAIAETQAANPTNTQLPTPTNTLARPTRTNIPPTKTPVPKTTYIVETGWCMLDVSAASVSGVDPKTVEYCNLDARQQIELGRNEYAEVTLNNLDGQIQVYCAIFTLDGTFIMSYMDTTGSGKVACEP